MDYRDIPGISAMIPDDDELAYGLEQYSGKLDSYQAGTGIFSGGMGPQPPTQNQPSGMPGPGGQSMEQQLVNDMPESMGVNRMASMGMPGFMQQGEKMVDNFRANRWGKKRGMDNLADSMLQPDSRQGEHPADRPEAIEVDETEMRTAGGDAQQAYENNQGNQAARIGNAARGVADWYTKGGSKMFDWMKRG